MAKKGLEVCGEVSGSQLSCQQQQQHSTVGQITWSHLGAALPYYHKDAMVFIIGYSGHVFGSSTAWVFGESSLKSSLSVKWIAAFPGLNCPHQLKALCQ